MIEFPLIHENFSCVPYSGIEHRTALHRFDVLDFVDENGNTYTKDGLQNAINNEKLVRHYKRKMFFDDLPEEQESAVVNSLATKSNQDCKFLYQYI